MRKAFLVVLVVMLTTSCQKPLLSLTDDVTVIPACGGDTLAPKSFFWIDPDLKTRGLNESVRVGETPVQIYELNGEATWTKMFSFINEDFRDLCLTPAQIIEFCEEFPSKLSRTGENFFLAEKDGAFFVFSVQVHDTGLMLFIDQLHWYDEYVWHRSGHQIICSR